MGVEDGQCSESDGRDQLGRVWPRCGSLSRCARWRSAQCGAAIAVLLRPPGAGQFSRIPKRAAVESRKSTLVSATYAASAARELYPKEMVTSRGGRAAWTWSAVGTPGTAFQSGAGRGRGCDSGRPCRCIGMRPAWARPGLGRPPQPPRPPGRGQASRGLPAGGHIFFSPELVKGRAGRA